MHPKSFCMREGCSNKLFALRLGLFNDGINVLLNDPGRNWIVLDIGRGKDQDARPSGFGRGNSGFCENCVRLERSKKCLQTSSCISCYINFTYFLGNHCETLQNSVLRLRRIIFLPLHLCLLCLLLCLRRVIGT